MLLNDFGLQLNAEAAIATEALIAALAVFGLSALALYFLIPVLRAKKIGQTIYELGPSWHKNKQGVPTMGGIGFIPPFLLVLAVYAVLYLIFAGAASASVLIPFALALLLAVSNAAIGFIDDYCKLLKKHTRTEAQKEALKQYVLDFHSRHPDVAIVGHNALSAKACPSFDVPAWLREIGIN